MNFLEAVKAIESGERVRTAPDVVGRYSELSNTWKHGNLHWSGEGVNNPNAIAIYDVLYTKYEIME